MAKAQGISINTIIIAAIALIVLVVLIAVFTGRMSLLALNSIYFKKENFAKTEEL